MRERGRDWDRDRWGASGEEEREQVERKCARREGERREGARGEEERRKATTIDE